MSRGAESPAQRSVHVALEQLTEQDPVQVMWQVELPEHETLPLGPRVAAHVELPVQLRLHDSAHEPRQDVWFEQVSEQLPEPSPQDSALNPQLSPELHEQLDPLQMGGGGGVDPPQAERASTTIAITPGIFSIGHCDRKTDVAHWRLFQYAKQQDSLAIPIV